MAWRQHGQPSPSPLPPLLAALEGSDFVGRDAELAQLRSLWDVARAGASHLVLLAGEPGIGKTRLAAELARIAFDEGATVLFGRCDDEKVAPYQPFVEALGHYAASRNADELETELGAVGGDLARLLPELRARLDVPTFFAGEPEAQRYRLFDAVASWLRTISTSAPAVLIVDDLHWADKPTLRLLQHVARATDPGALLILGAYRDAEIDRNHPLAEALADLHRGPRFDRLTLAGLDESSVGALLADAAARPLDDVGRALAATIQRDTAGNPLFVREILRHLHETGAVGPEGSAWQADLDVAALGIPDLVTDVISQRLARLPEPVRQVLTYASVVGNEFSIELLEQLVPDGAEEVLVDLEAAVNTGLITEVPGHVGQFAFSHALVRQSLYLDLSGPRRARFHAQLGEALERLAGDRIDVHLPALAHHFAQAGSLGDRRRASDYARRAGEQAMAQFAYDEAAGFFNEAVQQLEAIGAGAGERGSLLLALGEAQFRAGAPDAARKTMRAAADVARQLERADWLARAALDFAGVAIGGVSDPDAVALLSEALAALDPADTGLRARVTARLAMELYAASLEESDRLADDAVALARAAADATTLAAVLSSRRWVLSVPDNPRLQLGRAEEIVQLAEQAGDRELQFQGHHYAVVDRLTLGDIEGCEREIGLATALAEELRQPQYLWQAAQYRVLRTGLRGEFDAVEQLATEAFEIGQRGQAENAALAFAVAIYVLRANQGRLDEILEPAEQFARDYPALPAWRAAVGWVHAELGRLDEAAAALRDLVPDEAALRRDANWLIGSVLLGDIASAVADSERSARLYDVLVPAADLVVVIGPAAACFGAVARTLGRLAHAAGRHDDAGAHFETALAIHTRLGAPAWVTRTERDRTAFS